MKNYSDPSSKEMRKVTLCLLVKNEKVLLAMKKRGFGAGKWNGVGGKLQEGESVKDAMIRETLEEISVTPKEYFQAGTIKFFFDGKPEFDQEMHVFVCRDWLGNPEESDEMSPKWFDVGSLPFDDMWEDDRVWLPLVLSGKTVNAAFFFDGLQKLTDYRLEPQPV